MKLSKIIIALLLERLHRYVFDNLYVQDNKILARHKPVLLLYKFWSRSFPDFRSYLKEQKKIGTWPLSINTARYSDKIFVD